MIFETQRLILRPWQSSDAESLYEYAKDPDIGPIAGWFAHKSIEESKEIISSVLSKPENYAVCLKTDNRAIGSISLILCDDTDMTDKNDECELGYWIGKPFWGMGYIPEAVRELERYAFEELGMSAVWCGFYDGNDKSKRVQEKCGFIYQFTSYDVDVPIMKEKRIGHVSLLTKQWWESGLVIRALKPNEVYEAMELAWEVFEEFDLPETSDERKTELHDALFKESFINGLSVYGAFLKGSMIGMLSARGDHICQLFVRNDQMRKGYGSLLFQRLLEDRVNCKLTVNSSDYAIGFYKSLGFEKTAERQTKNGLFFTPMKYE